MVSDFSRYTHRGEVFLRNYKEGIYKEKMLAGPNDTDKYILANMCPGVFCQEAIVD